MLNWFRRKVPESAENVNAGAVRHSVQWWLLMLRDPASAPREEAAVAELAPEYLRDGATLRVATCSLVAPQIADLILAFPSDARAECLAFMESSPDCQTLWQLTLVEHIMAIDVSGPHTLVEFMKPGVRAAFRKSFSEKHTNPNLSEDANRLYLGVRHVWERCASAVSIEPQDASLREAVNWVMVESVLALEGLDAEARSARRAALS